MWKTHPCEREREKKKSNLCDALNGMNLWRSRAAALPLPGYRPGLVLIERIDLATLKQSKLGLPGSSSSRLTGDTRTETKKWMQQVRVEKHVLIN